MEFKDYYKIMGVDRGATQDDIKRSYRKLARKYHPDVSKEVDAETRFKEIGEAYEVLKDPEKRAAYDQLGMHWKGGQDFRPPPGWDAGFEFRGAEDEKVDPAAFSDFFESLFGRGSRSSARQQSHRFHARGEDHHAKVLIRLEDAYNGARKTITLRSPEIDQTGHVHLRERSLSVLIPKGVRQGQKIRLAGQGAVGLGGGQSGDLYLEIEIESHPLYRVHQKDVYIDLPVAPWEAALGAKIKVPTPSGTVELNIPANTQSGSKLRLKGRGIPGNPAGDIFVSPQIVLPPVTDERSKEVYLKMKDELGFNPRSDLGV
jgi:curved DNA-binding protein